MEKIGSHISYTQALLAGLEGDDIQKNSKGRRISDNAHKIQCENLRYARETKDIEKIFEFEKQALLFDQKYYVNHPDYASSVANALNEFNFAINTYQKLISHGRYAEVLEEYGSHKNQKGGLPFDQARQFFASNRARLLNAVRTKSSDSEKAVLIERKENMLAAQTIYISLQRKALGLEEKTATKEQALTR